LEKGSPEIAIDWIDQIQNRVEEEISTARLDEIRQLLFKKLAKIIFRRNDILSHTLGREEFYKETFTTYKKLTKIGENLKDRTILGMANIRLASASYIREDYKNAARLARKGIRQGVPITEEFLPLKEVLFVILRLEIVAK